VGRNLAVMSTVKSNNDPKLSMGSYSTVSAACTLLKKRLKQDRALREQVTKIRNPSSSYLWTSSDLTPLPCPGEAGETMAKELQQEPAVLSTGLEKLAEKFASNPELRGVVETLCDSLRKGRRRKRSIRFA